MGVALVMIVLYAMNKIVAISDAFVGDKKQAAGGRALSSQEELKGGDGNDDNNTWRQRMISGLKSIG